MPKVIEVVDTRIFKEKLEMADIILPFASIFLSKKKYIAQFLGVSSITVGNMVKDGRFRENEQYTVDEKGNISFIPLGIIRYKIDPNPKLQQTYQPSKEALEFIN